MNNEENRNELPGSQKAKRKKCIRNLLIAIIVLLAAAAVAALLLWNSMLDKLGDAAEENVPTLSQEELDALLGTTGPTEPPAPEETWPVVVSDENITNIMLVGQNWREDEQNKLSDTMILCSINRETKTLTLVSILRDLYIHLPPYAGHGAGRNRINVCYALGSSWKRSAEGGMEMLALCVEQNFGIPVHHTVEVGFDAFSLIIDLIGGVDVNVTAAEAEYMTNNVGYIGQIKPGPQTLNGSEALAYARIRAIDGDRQRTARQRLVISSIVNKCRNMGLMELYALAGNVMPEVTTDMTNQEIGNYVWELLPMVKDLQIRTLTCPVDNETLPGSYWSKMIDLYGYPSSVIECNTTLNGKYLREALGMEEPEE